MIVFINENEIFIKTVEIIIIIKIITVSKTLLMTGCGVDSEK